MRIPLKIYAARPAYDYDSPFDVDDSRFTERWWSTRLSAHGDDRAFRFTIEGGEVARALVACDRTPQDQYVDLPEMHDGAKVWFFEVASDARRQGIGRQAIDLLTAELGDRQLFAHSEAADHFWAGIGWTHHPRADGDISYQPLFVQPAQRPPVRLIRRVR